MKWGEQWYEEHFASRPAHLSEERFGGYLARKQTHIHKLAMVLAASEHSKLEISMKNLSFANDVVTALENDMPKVFSQINADGAKPQNQLLSILKKHGKPLTIEGLHQHVFQTMGHQQFTDGLVAGIKSGLIKKFQKGNEVYLIAAEYVIGEKPEEGETQKCQ